MTPLISITGRAGHGKDVVASMIRKLYPQYEIKRFAGKLKEMVALMLGCNVEMLENRSFKEMHLDSYSMTVREILQRFGTESVRNNLHQDAWVNALFIDYLPNKVTAGLPKYPSWIIPDTRFLNGADAVKDRGGVIIKVIRPGVKELDHISEQEIDLITADYIIYNDGSFFDLEFKVKKAMEWFEENS